MEYLRRHPNEKTSTEKIYEKEYAISILSEKLKLNHKYGQPLIMNRKIPSNDQSRIMAWTTKRKSVNEIASTKKFILDVIS